MERRRHGRRLKWTRSLGAVGLLLGPLIGVTRAVGPPADTLAFGGGGTHLGPLMGWKKGGLSDFPEQQGLVLTAPLAVDVRLPGTVDGSALTPGSIPAGTRVNSHFVQLEPGRRRRLAVTSGSLAFDEPILGVILTEANLDASDAVVGLPGETYRTGEAFRGLEAGVNDTLVVAARSVEYDLWNTMMFADEFRVITGTALAFSLDIGSDCEFSDPASDGDEVFDPGDMVLASGQSGVSVFWDDVLNLTVTMPDLPMPAPFFGACAETKATDEEYDEVFDLDGFDQLDNGIYNDLSQGRLLRGYQRDLLPGFQVHRVEQLLLSFDDDLAPGWTSCSAPLPVESPSPTGLTFGRTAPNDELLRVDLAGVAYPYTATGLVPAGSESDWHVDLGPDPSLGELEDDDMDALDILRATLATPCFTVDHEGTSGLDPAIVYAAAPAAGVVALVLPANLGLLGPQGEPLPGLDLDAIEFGWLPDDPAQPSGTYSLALLFSVDDDDPQTEGLDESGGLDPTVIYASFLAGTFFPLAETPEDIDGIAAYPVD